MEMGSVRENKGRDVFSLSVIALRVIATFFGLLDSTTPRTYPPGPPHYCPVHQRTFSFS